MSQIINTGNNLTIDLEAMDLSSVDEDSQRFNVPPPRLGSSPAQSAAYHHPRDNAAAGFFVQNPHRVPSVAATSRNSRNPSSARS